MKVISLPIRNLLGEDYINKLRDVTSMEMKLITKEIMSLGIDFPLEALSKNIECRGFPYKFHMTANVVMFYDELNGDYFVNKNRFTGELGWHTKSQMMNLLSYELNCTLTGE